MNKLFSTLFAVVFATSLMAQSGLTCNDPIPVDSTYRARVEGPCEVWYTAGTYDLPLNVHFVPDNPNSTWGPEVQVDFTCVPGVYADSKIDSLINLVSEFDLEFPLELMCDLAGDDEQVEWDMLVDDMYRDQLAEFGVTYNVQAFVKVRFYEAGLIRLQPDTAFTSCLETADQISLDKEYSILANDSDRVFIMPYTDWQNDSIQFVWTGSSPATIWLATGSCEFLPSTTSGYVCANYFVQPGKPYRISNKAIKDLIRNNSGGGVFYAKVLSASEGTLLAEKIPMAAIQGGATLLEYGKTVQLPANATDALFCFPKTWGPTQFAASTYKAVTMYLAHSADFQASAADANVVAALPFCYEGEERALYLSTKELTTYMTGLADDYVYVRFVSEVPMSITPNAWDASDCLDESTNIEPNKEYELAPRSSNTTFRWRYSDFEGYPVVISWDGSGNLPVYVSDTCHYVLSSSNEHVIKNFTIRNGRTITVDTAMLNTWAARAVDGYFYVRFNPSNSGVITFATDKPAVVEPVVPVGPCVLGSTELKLNSVVKLDLSSVHTIYRINYAEWQAAGATLAWEGTSPLHTFLASTCTFPVAPHNRYVLDYEAVLPAGEKVMAADWLARMAQYVDEDGYLYIRFLTEFEGELTVK